MLFRHKREEVFRLDIAGGGNQTSIFGVAEQVAGVQVTFAPGLAGTLNKLPVVEPWTETTRDGLRFSGSFVMAEAIVR